MLKNYLTVALRSMWPQKGYTLSWVLSSMMRPNRGCIGP